MNEYKKKMKERYQKRSVCTSRKKKEEMTMMLSLVMRKIS